MIGLGEGNRGRELRREIEKAAENAGLSLTVWVRERIIDGLDAKARAKLKLVTVRVRGRM